MSLEDETLLLDEPFIVLATQVPFGAPGTYPLSEVQADRFAFSLMLEYPKLEDELKIIGSIDAIEEARCSELMTARQIVKTTADARKIYVSEPVKRYIVTFVEQLRGSRMLRIKPSTRATITLMKGSRALALIEGRDHVLPDDVKFLAPFVLQHRSFLSAEAVSEEMSPISLVEDALSKVPVPKEP